MEKEPTSEEVEFLMDELALLMKHYRLEDFGSALMKSVTLINKMIEQRMIDGSRDGIMKGMEIIIKAHPDIDDSFKRFAMAVFDKAQDEIRQIGRPN